MTSTITIPELPSDSSLGGSEKIPLDDGGTTKRTTVSAMAAYARGTSDLSADSSVVGTEKLIIDDAGTAKSLTLDSLKLFTDDFVNVQDYGAIPNDTTADNTAAIKTAWEAAITTGKGVLFFPSGVYQIGSQIQMTQGVMQNSYVSSIATATSRLTLAWKPWLNTGQAIRLKGYIQSGISATTVYYAREISTTVYELYDTRAHAEDTASTTGRITFADAQTTTGSISSGASSLVVADLKDVAVGHEVKVTGASNSNGGFLVTAIDVPSKTLTLSQTSNATVSNAAVTYVTTFDIRDVNHGIRILGTGSSILLKKTAFSGAIFRFQEIGNVFMQGLIFDGAEDNVTSLVAGHDLINAYSVWNFHIDNCEFRRAADSMIKTRTGTTDPVFGVNTNYYKVTNCVFRDGGQCSTTTNDFIHGGTSNIVWTGNYARNIAGWKFADRYSGADNFQIFGNMVEGPGVNFSSSMISMQSISNAHVHHNVIKGYTAFHAISWGTNTTSGVVPFASRNIRIEDNIVDACLSGIRIDNVDYSGGTGYVMEGVSIARNILKDMTGTGSNYPISLTGNPFKNANISKNQITGSSATNVINLAIEGSSERQNITIDGNKIEDMGASTRAICITRSSGSDPIIGVALKNNEYHSLAAGSYLYVIDNVTDIIFDGEYAKVFGSLSSFSALNNITIRDGWYQTYGIGLNIDGFDNASIFNTYIKAYDSYSVRLNSLTGIVTEHGNMLIGRVIYNTSPNGSATVAANRVFPISGASGNPSAGTFEQGDRGEYNAPTAGAFLGVVCVTAGTQGTLSGVTADTNSGSAIITANTITGLELGQYITVAGAGLTGVRITKIDTTNNQVTVSSNASATVSTAAVSFSAGTFKSFGAIAA